MLHVGVGLVEHEVLPSVAVLRDRAATRDVEASLGAEWPGMPGLHLRELGIPVRIRSGVELIAVLALAGANLLIGSRKVDLVRLQGKGGATCVPG